MPKKNKVKEQELSKEELKKLIAECEEAYHNSFSTNSCKEILHTYQAWCNAKERYYKFIKADLPVDESLNITKESDQVIDDFDLD